MKLCDLRESIEQSCGHEDYFPRNFIFLRSVGRCLTRVKSRQESELKVKNYRPPQVRREGKKCQFNLVFISIFLDICARSNKRKSMKTP